MYKYMYIAPIYTINIHVHSIHIHCQYTCIAPIYMFIAPIYMFIAPIYIINIHDIHFKDKNYNDHVFTLIIYRNVNV